MRKLADLLSLENSNVFIKKIGIQYKLKPYKIIYYFLWFIMQTLDSDTRTRAT